MANVEDDTDHFIALIDLPRVNARTKVSRLFEALDKSTRNGVVVWDDEQPRWYVDRTRLASEVLRNQKEALAISIGELLSRSNEPALKNTFSDVDVPAGAPVPEKVPLGGQATADVFYRVTGAQGVVVGYLCSRETLKKTVFTAPNEYECTGPIVHKNRFFNDGRCMFCPFPLKA